MNPSTVSRVLSGDNRYKLTEDVRRRILAVAERRRYAPSGAGRALARRRSFKLGVILGNIERDMGSPYFSMIFGAFCREAMRRNYQALMLPVGDDDIDMGVLTNIRSGNADAYLVGNSMIGSNTMRELERKPVPVVIYSADTVIKPPRPRACVVSLDVERGFREMFAAARARGFRSAALFCLDSWQGCGHRFRCYALAAEYGLNIAARLVVGGSPSDLRLRAAAAYATESRLAEFAAQELIICQNDMMALGLCDSMSRAGLEPGRDISVIGFDNIEDNANFIPLEGEAMLATIDTGLEEVGRKMVAILLEKLDAKNYEPEDFAVATSFVARRSFGHPHGTNKGDM